MDKQQVKRLKQRYAFEEWQNTNRLEQNLFVWKYVPSVTSLPGWTPYRVQVIKLPQLPAAVSTAAVAPKALIETTRAIRSIWHRPEGETQVILGLDIYECVSREAAHELLLQLLNNTQSPLVERLPVIEVGDVAFSSSPGSWILFARANVIVIVRNAGRTIVPVMQTADSLDKEFYTKPPETVSLAGTPRIKMFQAKATKARVGSRIPLDIEVVAVQEKPHWYKIFSESGEVEAEKGRLVYRPLEAKPQQVVLYAVSTDGATTSQALRLDVE